MPKRKASAAMSSLAEAKAKKAAQMKRAKRTRGNLGSKNGTKTGDVANARPSFDPAMELNEEVEEEAHMVPPVKNVPELGLSEAARMEMTVLIRQELANFSTQMGQGAHTEREANR